MTHEVQQQSLGELLLLLEKYQLKSQIAIQDLFEFYTRKVSKDSMRR